jgi:flavorubredoxin
LGSKVLRFIGFPCQMHLWEGLVVHEETNRILFSDDLCSRFGEAPEPTVKAEIDQEILNVGEDWLNIPDQGKILRALESLKTLKIDIIAPMHGPTLKA